MKHPQPTYVRHGNTIKMLIVPEEYEGQKEWKFSSISKAKRFSRELQQKHGEFGTGFLRVQL